MKLAKEMECLPSPERLQATGIHVSVRQRPQWNNPLKRSQVHVCFRCSRPQNPNKASWSLTFLRSTGRQVATPVTHQSYQLHLLTVAQHYEYSLDTHCTQQRFTCRGTSRFCASRMSLYHDSEKEWIV